VVVSSVESSGFDVFGSSELATQVPAEQVPFPQSESKLQPSSLGVVAGAGEHTPAEHASPAPQSESNVHPPAAVAVPAKHVPPTHEFP